jgi:Rha family phage regulatory protein
VNELIINDTKVSLTKENGSYFTTSLDVAKVFGKRHSDVLRIFNNIKEDEDFTQRNCALSTYKDTTGRTLKMVKMNRDMFGELVMGFTGAKAKKWRRDYIKAFNLMEKALTSKIQLSDETLKAILPKSKLGDINNKGNVKTKLIPSYYRSCSTEEINFIVKKIKALTKKIDKEVTGMFNLFEVDYKKELIGLDILLSLAKDEMNNKAMHKELDIIKKEVSQLKLKG